MKKLMLFLLSILFFVTSKAQTKQQIDNETTFTKLYGYVRYFHPSDEAAAIDWNRFAIYGAKKVEACKNSDELKATLSTLFSPIAPTLQIADDQQNIVFDKTALIPSSLQGYKTVAWQHVGVGLVQDKEAPYQSGRTNRPIIYTPVSQKSVIINKALDIRACKGKLFKLKGKAKMFAGDGSGYFSASVYNTDKKRVWYGSTDTDPITNSAWKDFEIAGKFDSNADKLYVNIFFQGSGEWWIDDVSISVKSDTGWIDIYSNSFNDKKTGEVSSGLLSDIPFKINPEYQFSIIEDDKLPGQKWASVKSRKPADSNRVEHTEFFKASPQVGEYISKDIGSGLKIIMPLALYGDSLHTYPIANNAKLLLLNAQVKAIKASTITGDSLYTRLADVVISWNVFQHFFPYFENAKTDWLQDMRNALTDAYAAKDGDDFLKTLQKFTAKLKDGHIDVYSTYGNVNGNIGFPPFTWEWVENKLVVTNVLNNLVKLNKGDIVTAINGEKPEDYFKNAEQYISAATDGWLHHRSQTETVIGEKRSPLNLNLLKSDGAMASAPVDRAMSAREYYKAMPVPDSIRSIGNGIMYLNIGTINMSTINKVMPQLKKSRAIICDMRGNTTDNYSVNDFIEDLLTQKDTASHWLKTPEIIYPDQEKIVGYQQEGFDMNIRKPHITAKIIFLIDGSDISWAESYMSLVEHYKLATIIGQPTAGTNGDTNALLLPGGYATSFTGLKATKLDGSQHHGVGTKPDIYVDKTIKGVRENRDEFLEKAIETANK